jgi:hypothetical protein
VTDAFSHSVLRGRYRVYEKCILHICCDLCRSLPSRHASYYQEDTDVEIPSCDNDIEKDSRLSKHCVVSCTSLDDAALAKTWFALYVLCVRRCIPLRLKDKLASYILVLCLILDEFQLECDVLMKDLKIGLTK